MTPAQQRIAREIDELRSDIATYAAMDCTSDADVAERQRAIGEAETKLTAATGRMEFENKVADIAARAAAAKATPATLPAVIAANNPGAAPLPPAEIRKKSIDIMHKRDRALAFMEDPETTGRYLRSLYTGERMEQRGDFTTATEAAKSLGERIPTYNGKGAELVGQGDVYNGILGLLSYDSLAWQLAMKIAVNCDRLTIPRSDADVEADWYLENTEIQPVNISTTGTMVNVDKIGARAQASNELIADASPVSVASLITSKFSRAFALKLDKTWLSGNTKIGVDGLLTKKDGTTSNLPTGQEITQATKGTLTVDEMIAAMGAVSQHARGTAWLVSPAGWGQVMVAAKKVVGSNLQDGVPFELFGSPVYKCEAMPATHLAVYGDFQQATQIAVRQNAMEIMASRERAIEYYLTVFVAVWRLGLVNSGMSYVSAIKAKTT